MELKDRVAKVLAQHAAPALDLDGTQIEVLDVTDGIARLRLGGVCGGIADWLGWDPTLVRVLYIVGSIMSAAFPGTIVYIVLWIVMPEGDY